MLNIPLPFVISLFLLVLLIRLASQRDRRVLPVIVFVGSCTALAMIAGLRWSFDWQVARSVQPVIASILPPLAWVLFSGLTVRTRSVYLLPHIVPVALVLIFAIFGSPWRSAIDLILAASYFGYALALLWIAAGGPDRLTAVRFSSAVSVNRAALLSGLVLLMSGMIDVLVAGELFFGQGAYIQPIIAAANLITLAFLAYAVSFVGHSLPHPDDPTEEVDLDHVPVQPSEIPMSSTIDKEIVVTIDRLIRDRQLYRDPELTLNRLARKALIPTRQISGAVNRVLGKNMSQVMNGYRIEEAKRLLLETDLPVTSIMFDAGFQTKSNFNREFLRAVGKSPSDFRRLGAKEA